MCYLLGIGSESGCVSASKSNFGSGPGSAFEQYQSDFHKLRGLLPAWISIRRVRNAHYLDAWTRQVILSAPICMFPFLSSQETGPFLVKIIFLYRKALVWRCSGRREIWTPNLLGSRIFLKSCYHKRQGPPIHLGAYVASVTLDLYGNDVLPIPSAWADGILPLLEPNVENTKIGLNPDTICKLGFVDLSFNNSLRF